MRIDHNTYNLGIGEISDQMKANDLFDLDLKVTYLKNEHQSSPQVTSHSACTPGCGNTGTGNSFCCSC